jgi:hypothetical protein
MNRPQNVRPVELHSLNLCHQKHGAQESGISSELQLGLGKKSATSKVQSANSAGAIHDDAPIRLMYPDYVEREDPAENEELTHQ